MSAKTLRKTKVSVNDVISSEEEMNSNSDLDQMNDEFDDNNDGLNDSDAINSEDNDSEQIGANSGWADAISKVLSVKSKDRSLILSKAKKDKDIKRKTEDQTEELEVVKSDGTVVQIGDKQSKKLKSDTTSEKKIKLTKKEWEVMHKVKPKDGDKEKERLLCSIATKGVVQLFNAVREQQKTIETKIKEVGPSETKKDKMLSQFNKNQFLDKLKQKDPKTNKPKKDKTDKTNTKTDKEEKEEQKWKVLRDDFMIGAKMKDWDKDSDSDEELND